jgi:uncharacterized LabA/DUF88 family protein
LAAAAVVYNAAQMKRAAFYIDGFNLYHSILNLRDPKLKWLSLASLCKMLVPSRTETANSITYFSATATHRGAASIVRHKAYISALKSEGVECVLGRFKDRYQRCRACGHQWNHPEEKETDVSIAIRMVADGFQDKYDVCYLVSADTDLVPALKLIRSELPTKEIVAVSPPGRPHGQHIKTLAHRSLKLNRNQIERSKLPKVINWKGQTINCPPDYL